MNSQQEKERELYKRMDKIGIYSAKHDLEQLDKKQREKDYERSAYAIRREEENNALRIMNQAKAHANQANIAAKSSKNNSSVFRNLTSKIKNTIMPSKQPVPTIAKPAIRIGEDVTDEELLDFVNQQPLPSNPADNVNCVNGKMCKKEITYEDMIDYFDQPNNSGGRKKKTRTHKKKPKKSKKNHKVSKRISIFTLRRSYK